jgi:hypothetical protein
MLAHLLDRGLGHAGLSTDDEDGALIFVEHG